MIPVATATPMCKSKLTKTKVPLVFRVQDFCSSDTDAAAGAAAATAATAAATAAASAAAIVATTVKTVVKTRAAAEAAAVAAAVAAVVAAAPAAASVFEEQNSETLNIHSHLGWQAWVMGAWFTVVTYSCWT